MPAIENRTPFAAKVFATFDSQAREQIILVVAASFTVNAEGRASVADEQYDISPVDSHWGDPATTSIRQPGQLAFAKSCTDIILTGHACAPRNRRITSMEVSLQVADVAKTLLVSGDRFWKQGVIGKTPSAPKPFERMPVTYERAFGGGAGERNGKSSHYEVRNPVGVGIAGNASLHSSVITEVPNVEYLNDRQESVGDRPRPAGFGALAPGWKPRIDFAGTYDAKWLTGQAPLLPADFDVRFFQLVPEDQRSAKVKVGDVVRVIGMTPEGIWQFQLPRASVPLTLIYANRLQQANLALDTIHLESDLYRVTLIGRLVIGVRRNCAPLGGVILGKVSAGWVRARSAGKVFLSGFGRRS